MFLIKQETLTTDFKPKLKLKKSRRQYFFLFAYSNLI